MRAMRHRERELWRGWRGYKWKRGKPFEKYFIEGISPKKIKNHESIAETERLSSQQIESNPHTWIIPPPKRAFTISSNTFCVYLNFPHSVFFRSCTNGTGSNMALIATFHCLDFLYLRLYNSQPTGNFIRLDKPMRMPQECPFFSQHICSSRGSCTNGLTLYGRWDARILTCTRQL